METERRCCRGGDGVAWRGGGSGDGDIGGRCAGLVLSLLRAMTISTSLAAFCKMRRASCSDIPRKRRPLTLMISSPTANRPSLITAFNREIVIEEILERFFGIFNQ